MTTDDVNRPKQPLATQPTAKAGEAIAEFIKTGAWPKPGTLPTCIRLGR